MPRITTENYRDDCGGCMKPILAGKPLVHPGRWPLSAFHTTCAKKDYPVTGNPREWDWTQFNRMPVRYFE